MISTSIKIEILRNKKILDNIFIRLLQDVISNLYKNFILIYASLLVEK